MLIKIAVMPAKAGIQPAQVSGMRAEIGDHALCPSPG
jgi:hypothetical protein